MTSKMIPQNLKMKNYHLMRKILSSNCLLIHHPLFNQTRYQNSKLF